MSINNRGRRQFVTGLTAGCMLSGLPLTARAQAKSQSYQSPQELRGPHINLDIDMMPVNFTGQDQLATVVNQSVPAPTLRFKEGQRVSIKVNNHLKVDSSIHWHGIILPTNMDGVPGLSFDGIKPGQSYHYEFDLKQNGTYWYHSHSGFQEQTGLFGALIIDPAEPEPFAYDRDYVVQLSDWSEESPTHVYANLKKLSHYYNFQERTAGDLWRDIKNKGLVQTWRDREMWNEMRMSDRDISDVTGYTYTYLMNGNTPDMAWRCLFNKGEKIRLRVINASAMSIFDFRIPGLKMTVVASDGQYIQPVTVDEFRIGVAETYDVIVEPDGEAYTLFAQTIDRSGYARGVLAQNTSLMPEVPKMDPPPILTHRDMGMDHSMQNMGDMKGMDHSMQNMGDMKGMDHSKHNMGDMKGMDHSKHNMGDMKGMDHSKHNMSDMKGMHHGMKSKEVAGPYGKAGFGGKAPIKHHKTEYGPQVDALAMMPMSGLNDPGIGLRDHQEKYGRKVLTYADIFNLTPTEDKREPTREIQLHLTGNMSRYMWSFDGVAYKDADPIRLKYGERVRITLVNDTMMTHPIHLHGLWSELETHDPNYIPKKHTILVQPGSKISYLVTADSKGRWAYHCHLLYHMMGMFREVEVV